MARIQTANGPWDFFRLGPVLDWIHRERDSIRDWLGKLDDALTKKITEHRSKFDSDGEQWLDRTFPFHCRSAARGTTHSCAAYSLLGIDRWERETDDPAVNLSPIVTTSAR